jgi:hypothetical protein
LPHLSCHARQGCVLLLAVLGLLFGAQHHPPHPL